MPLDDRMTIGDLARKAGVSVRTLQYYDKQGLLSPSARSAGGRRLYNSRDLVCLHQILSLKYLGFSLDEIREKLLPLDSPEEVACQLERQEQVLSKRIEELSHALGAVQALRGEVLRSHQVDFYQYANIISLFRINNEEYWVVEAMDHTLTNHIMDRYQEDQEAGAQLFSNYQRMVDVTLKLIKRGVPPDGEEGQALAAEWWQMVVDFTGGDLSLLPSLMAFNDKKEQWDPAVAKKQEQADQFLNRALEQFFIKNEIEFPLPEE